MYWIRRIASKIAHIYYKYRARGLAVKGKILMFHNIGATEACEFNISVSEFEACLKRIIQKGVVRLEEWKESSDFYAISIDDVPKSFYENGFPLLKQYNVPFTLFVATELLNKEGYITVNQLTEMAACTLCTIGSHGINHGEYTLLSKEEKNRELSESSSWLSQLTGRSIEMYAFPYGSLYACGYGQKHLVADYYKYGFGTVQLPVTDPAVLPDYYIPRLNVTSTNISTI